MTTGNEPKIEEQIEKAAHQDWCRWWSHGDLCSCGAVSAIEKPVPVEPYGYVYITNNTWTHFTTMKPPDDAYDEGSLVPVYAAPAEQDRVDAVCQWEQDDEGGYWETQCGEAFEIIDGTPEQNGMKYCHHCGKKLLTGSDK